MSVCNRFRHRLCLVLLAAISCGALSGLGYFSYKMDPFGLYHDSQYIPDEVNPARQILTSYSYVTKAKRIREEKPSHIILGSSIVDNGFRLFGSTGLWSNPYQQFTRQILLAGGTEAATYYNAAIRGGGMPEALQFLQYAFRSNPKLDSVILGVEYSMFFTKTHAPMPGAETIQKVVNRPFSFALEYLLSPLALKSSYQLLRNSPKSVLVAPYLPPEDSFLPSLTPMLLKLLSAVTTPKADSTEMSFSPSTVEVLAADKKLEFLRFAHAMWLANGLHKEVVFGTGRLHSETESELRQIVEFCRTRGIRLEVFRSPQPAVFWAVLDAFGFRADLDGWYLDVASQTPVWDFAASMDYSPKADSLFSTDTLHFSPEGGEMILPVILKSELGKARRVDASTVRDAIAQRATLLEQWKQSHAEVWDAIRTLAANGYADDPTVYGPVPPQLMPVLLEPAFKGYRIVRVFEHYVAVPVTVPLPYDGYKLVNGSYPGELRDADVQGIQNAVERVVN